MLKVFFSMTSFQTPVTKRTETPNRTDFLRKERAAELEHGKHLLVKKQFVFISCEQRHIRFIIKYFSIFRLRMFISE